MLQGLPSHRKKPIDHLFKDGMKAFTIVVLWIRPSGGQGKTAPQYLRGLSSDVAEEFIKIMVFLASPPSFYYN
jgi:hypothetical protein